MYAIYLIVTARKGISSLQLSKELGVTQKTAWFMLQRIREACGKDDDNQGGGSLSGIVEVDETFIAGKEANKHASKKKLLNRHELTRQNHRCNLMKNNKLHNRRCLIQSSRVNTSRSWCSG
jgi:hypothetical protein